MGRAMSMSFWLDKRISVRQLAGPVDTRILCGCVQKKGQTNKDFREVSGGFLRLEIFPGHLPEVFVDGQLPYEILPQILDTRILCLSFDKYQQLDYDDAELLMVQNFRHTAVALRTRVFQLQKLWFSNRAEYSSRCEAHNDEYDSYRTSATARYTHLTG
jgi:hypothetical protein